MVEPKRQLSVDRRRLLGWVGGAGILGGSVTGLATEFAVRKAPSEPIFDDLRRGLSVRSSRFPFRSRRSVFSATSSSRRASGRTR
jgi:hypothetical protein